MNTTETGLFVGLVLLAAGCVERRVVYVPTYKPAPVYQGQPSYTYPGQTNFQSQPLVTQAPAVPGQELPAAPPPPNAVTSPPAQPAPPATAPPSGQVVVSQPPPAPPVEVIPAAPGPAYVWAPGYWSWNGGWTWIGGGWVIRPHPHAVWIGPRWERHGHGYVWVRGRWR
jgi:hypothetical protein